jgi:hypothetical protein
VCAGSKKWPDLYGEIGQEYTVNGVYYASAISIIDAHTTNEEYFELVSSGNNYNDGKCGWNGGECPVHPDTIIDNTYADGSRSPGSPARGVAWDEPLIFRVVKEYVEPVIKEYTGECWAYHHTFMEPSLVSFNVGGDCIKGKYTATHVDGKLKSITWDADDE